ncbi:hypothetical protein MPTK1_4g00160 [Marchantia polymorpha subsp. ruderalis]|uniref:Uncharacterized protein n=2 Tax=Marchantia polymorpha TaxID=3197 RepID=A0AAF6B4S1_MARPO|nr:hypothetical protein MARPO_0162s0005 [Marchantia polymorpha]BBN07005.1 hypothetical protein Mp_4g00160 [Marchantia polymorpha subsp. ruderalis]|eukprot:PTQ28472.1 hypothetical protein MARPO_0162s0005 [Marchantia polymorpha]
MIETSTWTGRYPCGIWHLLWLIQKSDVEATSRIARNPYGSHRLRGLRQKCGTQVTWCTVHDKETSHPLLSKLVFLFDASFGLELLRFSRHFKPYVETTRSGDHQALRNLPELRPALNSILK